MCILDICLMHTRIVIHTDKMTRLCERDKSLTDLVLSTLRVCSLFGRKVQWPTRYFCSLESICMCYVVQNNKRTVDVELGKKYINASSILLIICTVAVFFFSLLSFTRSLCCRLLQTLILIKNKTKQKTGLKSFILKLFYLIRSTDILPLGGASRD